MSFDTGSQLANYHLVARLGEGGMGVVWRATDTTLGRDVAIKVLPDVFAADPERLARFEREARVLAALNHPNVASIYGLQSANGVRFLAMELVEGEDLAVRLARGPIPADEAFPIALQIAEALEFAHERGVVHRDLKPANVALDATGRVKVLDFGLAKALEGDGHPATPASLSQSPTITGMLTSPHVLLGTAAYMSPEQARGQAADRRADIWAFGAVLMEMLTGHRLFQGDTISDTLASVLRSDPDWSQLPAGTPVRIRRLLQRCLERDPRRRLRDIGEARIVLEQAIAGAPDELAAAPVVGSAAAPPARRSTVLVGAAGLLAGGVIAFTGAGWLHPARPQLPLRKFQVAVTSGDVGMPRLPAISPDGRRLAYMSGEKLMVRDLGQLEARALDVPKDATWPFWSPDGQSIGFISGTKIMKVPAAGGTSETVCDTHDVFTGGQGASWLADGTIVFSRGDSMGVMQVPSLGGDAHTLIPVTAADESDLHEPSALPGGRGILFGAHRRKGGVNNINVWANGRRKVLLTLEGEWLATPVYSPTGHILFQRTRSNPGVWALPFSLARLAATGPPFLVAPDGSAATVAGDGTLSYRPGGTAGTLQIMLVDRDGKDVAAVGEPRAGTGQDPALSRDGRRVAITVSEGGNPDLWVLDVTRGTRTRLTFDSGLESSPSFSPSADRIAYHVHAKDCTDPSCYRVMVRAADGTGSPDTLAPGVIPIFSPDGAYVVYTALGPAAATWDLAAIRLDGDRKPVTIVRGNPRVDDGAVSPDGRYMAYMSTESGDWQVFLTRFPSGEGKWQVSTAGGQTPRWNVRGDRLYFTQGEDVMEVEVGTAGSPTLGTPQRLFTRPALGTGGFGFYAGYDVSPDGTRFVILRSADQKGVLRGLNVVQNWYAEFEQHR
jgi:eukaryotic-like serine/threonine-protein kinase